MPEDAQHRKVGEDNVEFIGFEMLQCFTGTGDGHNTVPFLFQDDIKNFTLPFFIINNEYSLPS